MPDRDRIALIGAPSSAGGRMVGQEQAPGVLRDAGLLGRLEADGHEVLDLGDVSAVTYYPDAENPTCQNLSEVLRVAQEVEARVEDALSQGAWPLVVGGDCTITLGVLAALTRTYPRLGLMYLDGDADLNTPATTHTGILDGMVIAHVLGRGADELSRLGSRCPLLEEDDITLFGYSVEAGGLDPVELELLEQTRMALFPLEAVRDRPAEAATRALRDLEARVDHMLVHFDIDVITHAEFPAVDVPHTPGLSLAEVEQALRVFARSSNGVGLVVTELNPARDEDGECARRLVDLIRAAV